MEVVPFVVRKKYGKKLTEVNEIEVDGDRWFLNFDSELGCVDQLEEMVKNFKIKVKETIVFNLNDTNTVRARIYQVDGMEIDYTARVCDDRDTGHESWFWGIDNNAESDDEDLIEDSCKSVLKRKYKPKEKVMLNSPKKVNTDFYIIISDTKNSGMDNRYTEGSANEENSESFENIEKEFTATLSKCHVDKKIHGLFIPCWIHPEGRAWQKNDEVILHTVKGTWRIGVLLNFGRPRFSSGWNKFVRENEYQFHDTLVLRMRETEERIEFSVNKI